MAHLVHDGTNNYFTGTVDNPKFEEFCRNAHGLVDAKTGSTGSCGLCAGTEADPQSIAHCIQAAGPNQDDREAQCGKLMTAPSKRPACIPTEWCACLQADYSEAACNAVEGGACKWIKNSEFVASEAVIDALVDDFLIG